MPFAERDGARIHWQASGKGTPLVLIMGLGCSSAMWFRLAPRLAKKHRVILLDNRGVGLTEPPRWALVHRVSSMAADVAAVLDAAGEAQAHVVGLSMGGMIAQQFALDFPQRLLSLHLLATNCGGPRAVLPRTHVWQMLFDKGHHSPQDNLRRMRPHTYALHTSEQVIEEDDLIRLDTWPTPRGYQAQLNGLLGWTSWHGLPGIACPVQVVHGLEDELIPPANGRLLAGRIPGAELVELEQASHWLHSDQPAALARELLGFIARRCAKTAPNPTP